jgi:dipeptidyl aminopeptidase/acylaminoacyl peptidase
VGRRFAACLLAVAALAAACGGGSGGRATVAPEHRAATTTTTTTPVEARPFHVTRREVTVVDTTRKTDADPKRGAAEQPSRTLPLILLVPDGPGPFPVFEFSHGHNGSGAIYAPFFEEIAAAGYIVVLPTFPLSKGPGGLIGDYVNQPGDVYFAVDAVIRMGKDPKDPLHGRVDAGRIALGGHSLGAITTIGAVYNSCCTQARVDAAISVSGMELPFPGGDFTDRPKTPLLLVHGDADERVPFSGSEKLYDAATGPVAFLRIAHGLHTGVLLGDQGALVKRAMVAWLDRWLYHEDTGWQALPEAVQSSRLGALQQRGL